MAEKEIKKDNRWKWIIIGFWVVLIIANIHFLKVALENKSELVQDKYYEAGVNFQENINRKKAFLKRYKEILPNFNNSQFSFAIKDSLLENILVHLYYPADKSRDQHFALQKSNDSLWTSKKLEIEKGYYKLNTFWVVQGDTLEQSFEHFQGE